MRYIQSLALILTLLAVASYATEAGACPGGYFRCGNVCCPK
jgi:hypothetical protein